MKTSLWPVRVTCPSNVPSYFSFGVFPHWQSMRHKKKFLTEDKQDLAENKSFQSVINIILTLNQNTVLYWEENNYLNQNQESY